MELISVIMPAYNEEKRIGQIIEQLKQTEINIEIIVVDNCSTDKTAKIALEEGVKVVKCNNQGKGYAMEEGLRHANGSIVIFVDADLKMYIDDLISAMVKPILNSKADFTKSTFKRDGGRVTELVAKPLLELLFPDMYKFEQPLSGIIAGKKELFEKIVFEKDYGVDIGILLDVINLSAKIEEVDIGRIENNSKEWNDLYEMAKAVEKVILERAKYIKK